MAYQRFYLSVSLLLSTLLLLPSYPPTAKAQEKALYTITTDPGLLAFAQECLALLDNLKSTGPRQDREDPHLIEDIQRVVRLQAVRRVFREYVDEGREVVFPFEKVPTITELITTGNLEIGWIEGAAPEIGGKIHEVEPGHYVLGIGSNHREYLQEYRRSRAVCGTVLHELTHLGQYLRGKMIGEVSDDAPLSDELAGSWERQAYGIETRFYRFYGMERDQTSSMHVLMITDTWDRFRWQEESQHWNNRCRGSLAVLDPVTDSCDQLQLVTDDEQDATETLVQFIETLTERLRQVHHGLVQETVPPLQTAFLIVERVGPKIQAVVNRVAEKELTEEEERALRELANLFNGEVLKEARRRLTPIYRCDVVKRNLFKRLDGWAKKDTNAVRVALLRTALEHAARLRISCTEQEVDRPRAEDLFELEPPEAKARNGVLYIRVPVFADLTDTELDEAIILVAKRVEALNLVTRPQ